jgi:hypothetical protein
MLEISISSLYKKDPPLRVFIRYFDSMQDIQKEIDALKARNKRVEADKARETSRTRKISIALLTYAVIVLFFYAAGLARPFLNALVPSIAFILSTLGLDLFKKMRTQNRK